MHTTLDPLRRALSTAHDRTAIVCGDTELTYAEFGDRCRRLATALGELGARPGDRIAVLAANCHRYLELYCAVPSNGMIVVPLNTRHSDSELRQILADARPTVLVTDRPADQFDDLVDAILGLGDDYEDLIGRSDPARWPVVAPDEIAGLFYTGGTAGASKGVILTHQNLIANTWHTLVSTNLQGGDNYLVIAPMYHAAGSLAALATIWLGGTQIVLPAFDPEAALAAIARHEATVTLGVPTMLAAINSAHDPARWPTDSIRLVLYGGSPIATDIVRESTTTFPNAEMCHLYGATELAPLAAVLRHHQDHLDDELKMSCGPPVVGVDICILDEDGRRCDPGTVGHVAVRGPNVMAGYWNKPKETSDVLRDGWYRTGDLGRLDDHANLTLVDRAKDMIVSGGENVYSTEVEEALQQHPGIREAAVFGIPHDTWGEQVHAVVVTDDPTLTTESIREHCRSIIAGYKIPKTVSFQADPLPKSGPGKILKRLLREPYWADHATRIQ